MVMQIYFTIDYWLPVHVFHAKPLTAITHSVFVYFAIAYHIIKFLP
jgi:hypothetical protein